MGEKIKKIRLDLGKSQFEFGQLFNPPAPKSAVSRWEHGGSPNKKRLKRIDEIVKEYEHAKKTENLKKIIPNVVLEARDRLLKKDTSFLYKKRYLKNSVLQGSCIIVTPKYIESENCIFEPDTKFYAEELLLALKCATLGYETIYSKKLKILHWHGMSSGFNVIPSKEALEVKGKRLIHAYNIYKETILSNPWKDNKNES